MLISILFVISGFVLLMWSADLLVDNATELATRIGISTLLIGIIIVGFGTSAPEMFVSAVAALKNQGNLALGNALGSNITNIGLVLGAAAFLRAIPVDRSTSLFDIPVVILAGCISVALLFDGLLSTLDGIILLVILVAYLIWSANNSRTEITEDTIEELTKDAHHIEEIVGVSHPKAKSTLTALIFTVGSIILLVLASQLLVKGAVDIATYLKVDDLIIGLTIVAIGTSLPELAAAIAAARKGEHQMIIGNVIGSNIFNTLGVLGVAGSIQATEVNTQALVRDFPIMFAFTLAMMLFAVTKKTFSRQEGGILLIAYFGYVAYLIFTTLSATA